MTNIKEQLNQVWICSETGLYNITGYWLPSLHFRDRIVTSGAVAPDKVAVVVDHHEVWQKKRFHWEKLVECDLVINDLYYTKNDTLLAATEQGRLACVSGNACIFNESFDNIPSRSQWRTPWGGSPNTHSITESLNGQLYVGIHMGWLARSNDDGKTWTQVIQNLDIDISDVIFHPQEVNTLAVATAIGLFVSEDSGNTFRYCWHGLPENYLRTIAIFPDCDIWIASAHPNAKPNATTTLYRSTNRGQTWQETYGISKNPIGHINTIKTLSNGIAIALAYESSFITSDYGESWSQMSEALPKRFFDPRRSFLNPVLHSNMLSVVEKG